MAVPTNAKPFGLAFNIKTKNKNHEEVRQTHYGVR